MGKDKKKRLEELIEEVDRPDDITGTQGSDSTESVTPSPESTTSETDNAPSDVTTSTSVGMYIVRFLTNPGRKTKKEILRAILVSLGLSFIAFVASVYLLVIQVSGYEKTNFFNSLLFSIVVFLYTFNHLVSSD